MRVSSASCRRWPWCWHSPRPSRSPARAPPAPPFAARPLAARRSASAPPHNALAPRLEVRTFQSFRWRIAMRALALVFVLLCAVPAVAAAQDAAALKREIEQLQKQLQSVTERLQRLEAQPAAPAQPPPAAPPAEPPTTAPPPTAQQPTPQPGISPLDIARPRQPFGLYQQRGAGQLLFDIGIAGDFVGELTGRNGEKDGGGSFPRLENRFFPREIERALFAQLDRYAS